MKPLVSIGIPTFNRGKSLQRSIESSLNQDYDNIEVIISDNASTDNTKTLCRQIASEDERVKYFRQEKNWGPTYNFKEALRNANGEYFMWLADDDWLETNYVTICLKRLLLNTNAVLVCGLGKLHFDDDLIRHDTVINLTSKSPILRVIKYMFIVRSNSCFYGIARKDIFNKNPINNSLASDWIFMNNLNYIGSIYTEENTSIHRSTNGTGNNYRNIVKSFGLPKHTLLLPSVFISFNILKEILSSSTFESLIFPKRFALAFIAAGTRLLVLNYLWWTSLIKCTTNKILHIFFSKKQATTIKQYIRQINRLK